MEGTAREKTGEKEKIGKEKKNVTNSAATSIYQTSAYSAAYREHLLLNQTFPCLRALQRHQTELFIQITMEKQKRKKNVELFGMPRA